MDRITVHILWGEQAVRLYRMGVIDNLVRLSHAAYDFIASRGPESAAREASAFVFGISQERSKDEWLQVTDLADLRRLGMPLKSRFLEAVARGNVAEVEEMLRCGVSVNATAPNGMTAIQIAAAEGHPEVVDKLAQRGANLDPDLNDPRHDSLMHLALANGRPEASRVVDVLLKHEAEVNRTDKLGRTPLILAMVLGSIAATNKLLQAQPKLEAVADDGSTAHTLFQDKYAGVVGDKKIDEMRELFESAINKAAQGAQRFKQLVRHPVMRPKPDGN